MNNESNIKLSRQSHKKILAQCDFCVSSKCKGEYGIAYRDYMDNKDRNNGKFICFNCSRKSKYSGRKNPNCKHKLLDDSFFDNVDSDEKAYILGFIASDGHVSKNNTVTISIHKKDIDILQKMVKIISSDLKILKPKSKPNMVTLTINSKRIRDDVAKLLNISPGNKTSILGKPNVEEKYYIPFIRGFFDGDGSLTNPNVAKSRYFRASIATTAPKLRQWIADIIKIPCHVNNIGIEWSCNNGLDFINKIYNKATIYLDRKYRLYELWNQYVVGLRGKGSSARLPFIKINRAHKDSVMPTKAKSTDSGYDLTVIEKVWTKGLTTLYDTGIKVCPDMGWYTIVVPRSCIVKTGYILTNSIGIIDRTYVGTIKIALTKIDEKTPDIELPCKIAQLIPMPIINFNIVEVDDVEETDRGSGGFGSTDSVQTEILEKYVPGVNE